jgi:hypothetical protein
MTPRHCRSTAVALGVILATSSSVPLMAQQPDAGLVKVTPLREAYYGDLHLHTSYSLDAYLLKSVGPEEAYRFARGETVEFLGKPARRREPLDFMAVTDHAENMGIQNQLGDPESVVSRSEWGRAFKAARAAPRNLDPSSEAARVLQAEVRKWRAAWAGSDHNPLPENVKAVSESAWRREIEYANRYYEPGKFTTLIAYEWTATPYGDNLHRNVICRGNSAPYPFTSLDSKKPEDLWAWLEAIRKQGYEALAIPHNANASGGLMYDWVDSNGFPIDRLYAEQRQANEPLTEIAQIKGASETHPLLSPADEFANYEILDRVLWVPGEKNRPSGSYVRDALGRGLVLQRRVGVNPYKYGFVGGSDLHSGLSVSDPADYVGGDAGVNLGGGSLTREQAVTQLAGPGPDFSPYAQNFDLEMSPGNLTGVWAESNTRESIYSALRRKETFATSGTRLKFRFFGGWSFGQDLLQRHDWVAAAYAGGVAMGGDLPAKPAAAGAPRFAVWASKDPNGANLDRIQIIKVWEERGRHREKVFDVAWSGERRRDISGGALAPVGNTVDLKTGTYTNILGAAELHGLWTDDEFDARRSSAYYLRVLEIATPRWTTLLAVRNRLPLPKNVPATLQQRGWSSPIWYTPSTQ